MVDVGVIEKALGVSPAHEGPDGAAPNYDCIEASRVITGNPYLTTRITDAKDLPPHLRILLVIISQNLNPRNGKHTTLTKRNIFWMYQILKKEPPNLSTVFLWTMKDAIWKNEFENSCEGLPYGKLVPKIIEGWKIPAVGAEPLVSVDKAIFSNTSLKLCNMNTIGTPMFG